MKAVKVLVPALIPAILLAACSQGVPQDENTAVYSEDNLATSEACFAEIPSAHLNAGETLIERGPSGIIRVSHALDGETADYSFQILSMDEADRSVIDAAAADFFRAAGAQYDPASDAVVYHRARDGRFCAVVKDETAGRALAGAAAGLAQAD